MLQKTFKEVQSRCVISLQCFTANLEHYFRDYYLIERGNQSFLVLNSNEDSFEGYEVIFDDVKLLESFNRSSVFSKSNRVLPNYARYEIQHVEPYFKELLLRDLMANIEGYHEDCFSREEKNNLQSFLRMIE